jgi:hypothetical protein
MFSEERDITPTASLAGKKSSGHSLISALKDNLDNHFDSESTVIKCFLAPDLQNPKKQVLITLDFGTGISPEKIHKMYVDNYSTKSASNRWTVNKKRRYLGRYGNGIKNVVGRLGGSVLTISKVQTETIYAVEYNPAKIEALQDFKATVWQVVQGSKDDMVETLRQYWLTYMVDEDGEVSMNGTMNVFKNLNKEVLDNLKKKLNYKPSNFEYSFGASFGETFERFLNQGDRLFVGTDFKNLDEVLPLNPFTGANEKFSQVFTYTKCINGIFEEFQVKCTVFVFPKKGTPHYREVTNRFSGVYFYRNDRLHLNRKDRPITTELPDSCIQKIKEKGCDGRTKVWDAFCGSHSRYALIRVMVEMNSDLDEEFGVNFIKTEMSLTSEIDDLSEYIFRKVRAVDPFKGKRISSSSELFEKYAHNHKKHIDNAIANVFGQLHDPEEISKAKNIISKFTKELGEAVI